VFTHDVVLSILLLKQYAEAEGVRALDQHVPVHQSSGCREYGTEELPWVRPMPVKKKISYIKNEVGKPRTNWSAAATSDRYEKEAK
jgi:hypothetical protein